jgi:3-phosphoshikimate 1-carboxyvinyltransferase
MAERDRPGAGDAAGNPPVSYPALAGSGVVPLRVSVPGDKSISHRAALLAAIACGTSRIAGFSSAGDCAATLSVLRDLGVSWSMDAGVLEIEGRGGAGMQAPRAALDCCRSGTTMRLAAGLLAGSDFSSELTGDLQLLRRPMRRIAEPLRAMGASVELTPGGTAPIVIRGSDLRGTTYDLPVASAQVKSAVLLAGLHAKETTTVVERVATRDHTERLLHAMGAAIEVATTAEATAVSVRTGELAPLDLHVPGDLSSAAALAAAALLRKVDLTVEGVGLNPTRSGFLEVLARMGAGIERAVHTTLPEPAGDLHMHPGPLLATEIAPREVPSVIDELPLVGVLATQAEGVTVVRGAQELRAKESDRIAGLIAGLCGLGADAEQLPDGFIVRGPSPLHSGICDARDDHRLAMAFSLASIVADGDVQVTGIDFVDDSFPGFTELLAAFH